MGSGLSREHSVKSAVKSPPRLRRPKGSLHSLIETDEEEEGAGCCECDCDCCREECDCVSTDGHMTQLMDRQRKLRCSSIEAETITSNLRRNEENKSIAVKLQPFIIGKFHVIYLRVVPLFSL